MPTASPRHIDLHLPTGWNRCTTDELEQIAAAVLLEQQSTGRYHAFSWDAVRVRLVFAINRLEIVEATVPDASPSGELGETADTSYLVRFATDRRRWYHRLLPRRTAAADREPFALSVGHVMALCENLTWIDDERTEPLLNFPYPTLTLRGRTIRGGTMLLDGYTWREYRHLQDWMQLYTTQANVLLHRISHQAPPEKILAAQRDVAYARAHFLAVLFRTDEQLPPPQADPLNPSQRPQTDPVTLFAGFDDVQWQVILFWWSGLMRWLIKTYPKCFKQDKPSRRSRPANPLVVYARTIATLEKYIGGGDEEAINRKSFQVVLQELQMMAEESDEMKKLKTKHQ